MPRLHTRRLRRAAAAAGGLVLVTGAFAGGVLAQGGTPLAPGLDFAFEPPRAVTPPPKAADVIANIAPGQAAPLIAGGVSIGRQVALYNASGTGPSALNTAAPAGTPERYLDPAILAPDGALPGGITITEGQAHNAFARVRENLASVGLTPRDVVSMRVFLDNPPGTTVADFAGFNRAFRQFYANTNLETNAPLDVPLGTGTPGPPLEVNPVRPARSALEVGSLPVAGWLVEIEVVARFARPR